MVARVRTVAFHGVQVIEVESSDDRLRTTGLHRGRIARQSGRRVARTGARCARRARLGATAETDHRQPRPGRCHQGRQHFDLPIALGLLAAMDVLPANELGSYTVLGELALDGSLTSVAGVLLAALAA